MSRYNLVTESNYEMAVRDLNRHDDLVHDTETTGLQWARGDEVCGVGLMSGENPYYFPFRHEPGGNLPLPLLKDLCERVLRPERLQLGFNLKFDLHMMRKEGMRIPYKIRDSQISAHALNENEPSFKMESLAAKYLDSDAGAEEDALLDLIQERFGGSRKGAKGNLWRLHPSEVAPYACKDLLTTRDLDELHRPALADWGIESLYEGLCEYSLVLTQLEYNGLQLDKGHIDEMIIRSDAEALQCLERCQELAGYPINLASPKQLGAWLGLRSTAVGILSTIADDPEHQHHEHARLILDYRGWSRQNSNYYRPFLERCDSNYVIHPNLNQTGTVGRLSCSNPNLTAIPRGSDIYNVKEVFKPLSEDDWFVEADLSQAEIRVCCHYSKDVKLTEMVLSGVNAHDFVSKNLNVPRHTAKNINFSAQYGIGAPTFAKTYGYSLKDARDHLKAYHVLHPGIRRLYNACEAKANRDGYIRLYTGRLQHFDGVKSESYKASNRLIQTTVSEMIRVAQIRLAKEVPEARQMLPVHDSVNFSIPKKWFDEIIREVRRIMQDQPWCTIPTKVDIKRGDTWGSAKEVPND